MRVSSLCAHCDRRGRTAVMRPNGYLVCNACWCHVCNAMRTRDINTPFYPLCYACSLEAQHLEAQHLEAKRLERQYEERHGRIMYAALCA